MWLSGKMPAVAAKNSRREQPIMTSPFYFRCSAWSSICFRNPFVTWLPSKDFALQRILLVFRSRDTSGDLLFLVTLILLVVKSTMAKQVHLTPDSVQQQWRPDMSPLFNYPHLLVQLKRVWKPEQHELNSGRQIRQTRRTPHKTTDPLLTSKDCVLR